MRHKLILKLKRLAAVNLPGIPNPKLWYFLISEKPLIALCQSMEYYYLNPLMAKYKQSNLYILYSPMWSKEEETDAQELYRCQNHYNKKYPRQTVVMLAASEKQDKLNKKYGVRSILSNISSLRDENIFNIRPEQNKIYDAIYNAQMMRYKRHWLAAKVRNLALITYLNQRPKYFWINRKKYDVNRYFSETKKMLPEAAWLNFTSGQYQKLNFQEVATCLNQARVGLCLSHTEGEMRAAAEYLFCGLPIVTTKSKGGRDAFFDKEYVKIVDAHPEAVRKGVEEMLERKIDPQYIRSKTLDKAKSHRLRLVELIQNICKKEGVDKTLSAIPLDINWKTL